jgi:Flp pilus assembly protein TadD
MKAIGDILSEAPRLKSSNLLRELVRDPEPMVRSAAVRTIGLDALEPAIQERLLTDDLRMVRLSATLASPDLRVAGAENEAELEAYLRHTADSPVGALRYGAYLQSRGQPEAAEQQVRQSVEFEERNPEAWRLAGIELHRMGHSGGAMQFLRHALGIDPGNAQILFNMGLLAYETGETDTALRRLSEAVQAQPAFEDAWYNLIVLYWSLNDTQTARAKLREALTHLPESQRLRQLARQL